MKNLFTQHPNKVGESYLKHFIIAIRFSFKLLTISCKVFIHAIFPFLFENSASDSISKLNDVLKKRKERFNLDDH